jgi:predicted nucleotidyltransferase
MQQLIPLIKDLADALQRAQLRFAFGGALANNYWGIIRTTQDVDCLVAIPALKYQVLADELNGMGCTLRDSSNNVSPLSVIQMRAAVDQRKLIECFRGSIRVELFVPVVPLQEEILRRAAVLPLDDRQIPVTTAEDLILLKLAFHREKDLHDVRGILWVQRGRLDLDYLKHWSARTLEDPVQQELTTLIEQYADPPEES